MALTDPRDVARIESKTVIVTQEQRDTVPIPKTGLSQLGRWMSEEDFEKAFNSRFPGCMKGEQNIDWIGQNSREPFLVYIYPNGNSNNNGSSHHLRCLSVPYMKLAMY